MARLVRGKTDLGENKSPTTIFVRANSPPAPAPWTARPAISIAALIAAPHNTLPTKKTATEASKAIFRPHISLSFPQVAVTAEADIVKAAPTQIYADVDRKCSDIVGSAVVMIVMSRAARKTDS